MSFATRIHIVSDCGRRIEREETCGVTYHIGDALRCDKQEVDKQGANSKRTTHCKRECVGESLEDSHRMRSRLISFAWVALPKKRFNRNVVGTTVPLGNPSANGQAETSTLV